MRAGALLNGAHHDVTYLAGELTHEAFVGDGSETLSDYLLCRISGNATKVFWSDVAFFGSHDAVFVDVASEDFNLTGFAVKVSAAVDRLILANIYTLRLVVGGKNRTFNNLHKFSERDLFFALKGLQNSQIDVH